jgi:hypothetical protein
LYFVLKLVLVIIIVLFKLFLHLYTNYIFYIFVSEAAADAKAALHTMAVVDVMARLPMRRYRLVALLGLGLPCLAMPCDGPV